ncbi:DUF3291 domain-containing protein [Actinocorallia sp. A-T 12471]|uniref:DUF3291 domain-containing protein n=1 Tax=Actinocorallia sp. A-T 12471 TaxID=3089813 RepID=UPI0029CAFC13|nr:DUF3291 domain-containing protein [Actinocorallia sp. A-T 12471]MDX6741418.1 DUF3291 domain-containing protein [Actinocorallia sp. A-T 12471]
MQLAVVNVARALAPTDSPVLAEFMAGLEPVNALADRSPGFVWRLVDDDGGDATSLRPYDDDRVLINLATWTSVDALFDFTYRTVHLEFVRRRREWFEHLGEPVVALWWVPDGHRPTPAEAVSRLEILRAHGPSPEAFTFRDRYPAPALDPTAS